MATSPIDIMDRRKGSTAMLAGLLLLSCLALQAPLEQQEYSIVQTTKRLRDVKLVNGDELGYNVPAEAKPLLKTLKHQLRDLITEIINSEPNSTATPEELEARVLSTLRRAGVEVGPSGDYPWYGQISEIAIRRPEAHEKLLAVTTTVEISCGNDTSLYLFERKDDSWELILALEANDYEMVRDAQGLFAYGLSEPDTKGRWFLVAVDITPWCTSSWQTIRYKVLTAGPSPAEPSVLFDEQESVWLGGEEIHRLAVESGGFTLSFWSWHRLDYTRNNRAYLRKFTVSGNTVTRVPPLALLPQDFLDEWISLPWSAAAQWVKASAVSQFARWHSRLQHLPYESGYHYSSGITFVQPCGTNRNKWQIGTTIDFQNLPDPLPEQLFFTVTREDDLFYLQDINTVRPSGCPGHATPEGSNKLP